VFLFPIFHPAAALYTPAMLETLRLDFRKLPALLEDASGELDRLDRPPVPEPMPPPVPEPMPPPIPEPTPPPIPEPMPPPIPEPTPPPELVGALAATERHEEGQLGLF
jgi:hypothetical protein